MTEDIKKILEDYKEEIKRHFDVVAEDLKDKIDTISEQVATNSEKITAIQEKLKEHDQEFGAIKDTLEIIKLDVYSPLKRGFLFFPKGQKRSHSRDILLRERKRGISLPR